MNPLSNSTPKKRVYKPDPKLPASFDRRIKIPKEDHDTIRKRVLIGRESRRAIAREYGVDKRLIQFIVDPEKIKHSKALREARGGWRRYYDKDKNTKAILEHRSYVRSILKTLDEKSQ